MHWDWDFVWLGMTELTPHIMAYYDNAHLHRNAGSDHCRIFTVAFSGRFAEESPAIRLTGSVSTWKS